MIVAVSPLALCLGGFGLAISAVVVAGAMLYRPRSRAKYRAAPAGPDVPPIVYGSSLETVQPQTRFGFFRAKPQARSSELEAKLCGATSEYVGRVNFGLSYDPETRSLAVHLLEAQDLPAKDLSGTSDPYVRVCLLPDKQLVQRTRVHRRTLCPKFSQTLIFPGHSEKQLQDMQLCMQMMDHDRFTRDDPIGEILLPMKNVKLAHAPVYWKHLQKPTVQQQEASGELMLSLCYLPKSDKVTVVVVKARDLPGKDTFGSSDPYVKLWLVHSGTKMEKRKTTVKLKTLTPVFNESFAFGVPPRNHMEDVHLAATVMDYDLITSNDEIGHVIIGRMGAESGSRQWAEMLEHPEHPTAVWHKLSPKW